LGFDDDPWIRKGKKGIRYLLAKCIEDEMMNRSSHG
jgi:hypothetical protein